MSIEATAAALAPEPVVEAPVEINEADELRAVYSKLNEEPAQEDVEQPASAEVASLETVEEPAEAPKPAVEEAPSYLPREVREKWAELPDGVRKAVADSQGKMARQLSDMGRQVQGIAPIRDSLVQAVEKFPFLASMKPAEVAQQVFQLAEVGQQLRQDPVATITRLAKQHGVEQALAKHFSGQPAGQDAQIVPRLLGQIQQLEQKLARVADPEYLSQQITQVTTQQQVFGSVNEFAAKAEHWAEVEDHIPTYIPIAKAKLGEGAAPTALLEFAYKKAVEDIVPKASEPTAAEAVADPDPDRTAKALKAVSVNVSGKATGNPKPLTEEEELKAVFRRAAKR